MSIVCGPLKTGFKGDKTAAQLIVLGLAAASDASAVLAFVFIGGKLGAAFASMRACPLK